MIPFQDILFGKPASIARTNQFNPEQLSALNNLMGMGMQQMKNPYEGFEDIAGYTKDQFNKQILPSIAERFTSSGGGALSSPDFASQVGQAGGDLASQLGMMRSQYGAQNRSNALGLLGLGLSPRESLFQTAAQPGAFSQMMPSLGRLGIRGLGAFGTGGISALLPALYELLNTMATQQKGGQK